MVYLSAVVAGGGVLSINLYFSFKLWLVRTNINKNAIRNINLIIAIIFSISSPSWFG